MLRPPLSAGRPEEEEVQFDGAQPEGQQVVSPEPAPPAEGGGRGTGAGGGQFDWAAAMKKITDAGFTREQIRKWRTEGISEQDKETLRKAGVPAQFLEMIGRGGREGSGWSGQRQGGSDAW